MARPKQARLSVEIIGQAAIDYVEAGNELQLVPLAKSLGVSVSSLYHHVSGREGVIRAMRQVLNERYAAEPEAADGSGGIGGADHADAGAAAPVAAQLASGDGREPGWAGRIRRECNAIWRMYAEHPKVLAHMLTVVIDEPYALEIYEKLATALTEAGVPDSDLLSTVEVIDAFILGAAFDSMSPDQILDPSEVGGRLAELQATHPRGKERTQRMYERGVDLIIAGAVATASPQQ